jgi:6-pyruvoyltetrahydropterin/6-carboxytetrahydropterin synthase
MKAILFRDLSFEAAHRNTSRGADPVCSRLHGHSYQARIWLRGEVDPKLGWLRDFADIKKACAPAIELLDHRLLNDVEGMGDSSLPDLTRWLELQLRGTMPEIERCRVEIRGDRKYNPIVQASPTYGNDAQCVSFWFAAAHCLPMLARDHKCRRLHGHSFQTAITARKSDGLAEFVRDVYSQLDHQYLNDIPGLENPTSEILAGWIWKVAIAAGERPIEVSIQETCTSGCAYRGE